jgi:excisionase family DNA binding protein
VLVRGGMDMTAYDARLRSLAEAPSDLADLPLMLTVGEAAAVLRISRTTAYKLIEENRATRGASGLPHVRLSSRIMVRRVDLARIVGVDAVR